MVANRLRVRCSVRLRYTFAMKAVTKSQYLVLYSEFRELVFFEFLLPQVGETGILFAKKISIGPVVVLGASMAAGSRTFGNRNLLRVS